MNGPAPLICHFAPRQFVCDCQHRPVPPSYTQIYICIYEFAYTKKASDSRPLDCSPVEILDLYETSRRRWRVKFRGKLLFLYTWKGVLAVRSDVYIRYACGASLPEKVGKMLRWEILIQRFKGCSFATVINARFKLGVVDSRLRNKYFPLLLPSSGRRAASRLKMESYAGQVVGDTWKKLKMKFARRLVSIHFSSE